MKNNKGITLVALIITIIVMLILAGISLTFTIGDNGVIGNAENAKEEKRGAEVAEIIDVWNAAKKVDILGNNGKRTTKTFNEQVYELVNNKLLSEKEAEIVRNHGIIKIGSRLITILDGAPKFQSDMKAVYWDDNNNEITSDDKNFDIEDYYSYSDKRWANAKTSDGSYWVWIPRYAYCIKEGAYSSTAGTIEIEFIDRYNELNFPTAENVGITIESDPNKITYSNASNGKAQEQYLVHPAFTRNADNGGGFGEITGIWVAKFEMSAEESADGGNTWIYKNLYLSLVDGNILIDNEELNIRVVSKQDVQPWCKVDITTSYLNSKNYDTSKNSHMIKNSEWGAIAYLSYSEYGNKDIAKNTSTKTGGGDFKLYSNQSSSGDLSGIYDLNGCYKEYVANYVISANNESINEIVKDEGNISTKYKTVYKENEEKKGDAIREVSEEGNYGRVFFWKGTNEEYFQLPEGDNNILIRGGGYSNIESSGVFWCEARKNEVMYGGGKNYLHTFRVCLVVD